MIALLTLAALAQDGVNAHGYHLTAQDGDLEDLLTVWGAETQTTGSISVGSTFEYASRPLVLNTELDGERARTPLLSDLFGSNLTVTGAPHERVAVAMNLPVWLASGSLEGAQGASFGDLRLSVPVGLLLADRGGLATSVVPFLDLPTGSEARFLGNPGVGGGVLAAAGLGLGPLSVDGNLGFSLAPSVDIENLGGGGNLLAAAGASWLWNKHHALRGETHVRPNLRGGNDRALTESPGELLGSVRGRYQDGISWTAGMGTAMTRGAGASPFRAFVGMGYVWGKDGIDDPDGDRIASQVDQCPLRAEVYNDWRDDDGCPDMLADLMLQVRNEDAEPVPDAVVSVGDTPATVDMNGTARLTGLIPASAPEATVEHPHYASWRAESVPLQEGDNTVEVALSYLPASVRVIAMDSAGEPVAASVRFDGPSTREAASVGEDGTEVWALRPGSWRVLVSADGYATTRATLDLAPGTTETQELVVTMAPARVVVRDTVVEILEKIHFDLDRSMVKADSLPLLREVANTLLDHDELTQIEIGGHTDLQGPERYNVKLSKRRVESVMTYLIAEGVAPERLSAVGYGEGRPISKGDDETTHAANRRVEFKIVTREAL